MNNGKICISVCAETADELYYQLEKASRLADLVEVRLDCLQADEFDRSLEVIATLRTNIPLLATLRPNKDADLTPQKREYRNNKEKKTHLAESEKRFRRWFRILELEQFKLADFEYDIHAKLRWCMGFVTFWGSKYEATSERELARKLKDRELILSEHYFLQGKIDLFETYDRIAPKRNTGENISDGVEEVRFIEDRILKIAANSSDIIDSIQIWKLLERAKADGNRIIPIAMGEAGKWTRILGLAHGAYLTYASLESGSETAPGQISAEDMLNVFRVKDLDESTDVYGIIAGNTSYTMSPYVHNAAFKAAGLNSVFVPLQVSDLDEFIRRMVRPETREVELNFKGFSVTNPHKQAVIEHLDELDAAARKIGAVNTIKVIDGKLHGYNTDAPGFIEPLKAKLGDLAGSRVAVFGAGGAARAVVYSLKNEGANVTVYARDASKAKILAEEFQLDAEQLPDDDAPISAEVVVNATPLGTKGEFVNATAATARQLNGTKLVYDLVYNPAETQLLKEAKSAGAMTLNGFDMLIAQAVRQFEIWTGLKAPVDEMTDAARKRLA
jgi:3-dehydroquinate dehydratase/shikimate dehydrogenase